MADLQYDGPDPEDDGDGCSIRGCFETAVADGLCQGHAADEYAWDQADSVYADRYFYEDEVLVGLGDFDAGGA